MVYKKCTKNEIVLYINVQKNSKTLTEESGFISGAKNDRAAMFGMPKAAL